MRRALAILPLLLVIGCGSGDTETVTVGADESNEPLSKSEYIEQADAICTDAQEVADEVDSSLEAADRRGDYQGAANVIEGALDDLQPLRDELVALPKPSGDEEVLSELDDLRDQSIALFERLVDALQDEDDSRISSLGEELASLNDQMDGVATGYGLTVCGQSE